MRHRWENHAMPHDVATEAEALSPPQVIALNGLLAGRSITEAAAAAGVVRETVGRWLSGDPAFVAALNRGKASILDGARARLAALSARAVDVLAQTMDDPAAPATARLKAAGMVLDALGVNKSSETEPAYAGPIQVVEVPVPFQTAAVRGPQPETPDA